MKKNTFFLTMWILFFEVKSLAVFACKNKSFFMNELFGSNFLVFIWQYLVNRKYIKCKGEGGGNTLIPLSVRTMCMHSLCISILISLVGVRLGVLRSHRVMIEHRVKKGQGYSVWVRSNFASIKLGWTDVSQPVL